jgi:hypothetical protein
MERLPNGELEFRFPDGRPLPEAPPLPPVPADGGNALGMLHAGAGLDADTLRSGWAGERFDVCWATDVLHP